MKSRKGAIKILIITAVFLTGMAYDPFIFFPAGLTLFYLFICYRVVLFVINAALKGKNAKNTGRAALACSLFLYFGLWAANRYLFPHKFHYISLIGDAGIALFTYILGWCLLCRVKKVLIISSAAAAFILFIWALSYMGSGSFESFESSSLEALSSLPYLASAPIRQGQEESGVTIYEKESVYNGLNMLVYHEDTQAHLMDMNGQIAHTWSCGENKLIYAEMYENGDILGVGNESMVKVDWNSNIVWEKKMRCHHDFAIADNNDIYTLLRNDEIRLFRYAPLPVLNEYILILSGNGDAIRSVSLYGILKNHVSPGIALHIYGWIARPHVLLEMLEWKITKGFALEGWFRYPADIFHTNTVEIARRDIKGVCRKGDLLICVRNFDLICILDMEENRIVWEWGPGDLRMPHHPTMLENGNMLIFDNGWEREYSRIVELDPKTKKIVWEYKAGPGENFFSLKRGANQRLPNGNTLITESDNGRVFEVTREGKTVWEFFSPVDENTGASRRTIYRMMRITDPDRYLPLRTLR